MARDTIYYKEWQGKTWKWRLEIIPADSEPLPETPNYEEIPAEALNIIDELEKKYINDLPIGLIQAEDLKIEFDLRWLPAELIEYITQPIQIGAGYITEPSVLEIENYLRYFDLTNVYILKTDKGSGGTLETIFIGCQKRSIKSKTKITMDGIIKEVNIVSLIKIILENITAMDISMAIRQDIYFNQTYNHYKRDYIFDLIWKMSDSNNYAKGDGLLGLNNNGEFEYFKIWLINMQYILWAIKRAVIIIGEQFMRATGYTCDNINNEFFHWSFYEQNNIDNWHGFGGNVTYENLYFIGFITIGESWSLDDQVGGFLVQEKDAPTLFDYKNAWDYLKALGEANYCKITLPINSSGFFDIKFERIFELAKEPAFYIDLNNGEDAKGNVPVEFDDGEFVIRKAQGNIKGMGPNDYDEMYTEDIGSLAEEDFEFKAVWHNLPTQIEFYKYIEISYNYMSETRYMHINLEAGGVYNNKLYYMGELPGFEDIQAVKIHERCEVDDGISFWPLNCPEVVLFDCTTEWLANAFLIPIINSIQDKDMSNIVSIVAYAIAKTFSSYSQSLFKPSYSLEKGITIENVGDIISINWNIDFVPYKDYISTDMFDYHLYRSVLISIKMNLKNELIETQIFVRGVGEGV